MKFQFRDLTGYWVKQATALVPHGPSRVATLAHTRRLSRNDKRRCNFVSLPASFPRLTRLIGGVPKLLLGGRVKH